ncbi:hypothetical protein H8S90_10130 [Olivibacter sp. SDN3]|uniref:hypothetical protein n=1 Tax=Olivibacter sp. SDN3 TaxID=2764720 RepID=UPI001650E3FA|nr:hypothetical protein [Olivibacter sp. SDN3]QNL51897.1 hypothetical protein H8S90_10130 [Olivibacter sp. SDN3]
MFEDYKKGIFGDYKREVINAYRKKQSKGELPSDLESPTPSKLRSQSLLALRDRYLQKDDQMLRDFFNPENKFDSHEKSINKFELTRFKPLVNFLKGETNGTSDDNIKLLAWLIGFEPRPYEYWRKGNGSVKFNLDSITDETQETDISKTLAAEDEHDEEAKGKEVVTVDEKPTEGTSIEKADTPIIDKGEKNTEQLETSTKGKGIGRLALYFIGAIVIAGVTYLFSRNSVPGCMFWADDHYQPISCKEKVQDATVIALDTSLVENQKKITQRDTLTKNALDKVWYVKINADSIEFYTADGFHPVYTDKKLKPVTIYILDKYVKN